MQPRRERRLPPKRGNLAKELQKSFLREIFRVRGVIDHPEAKGINAAAMEPVQELKSRGIAGLGQADSIRLNQRLGRLRRSLRIRIAWLISGQWSNSGASTLSDALDAS
jgi:hypothetical protein